MIKVICLKFSTRAHVFFFLFSSLGCNFLAFQYPHYKLLHYAQ